MLRDWRWEDGIPAIIATAVVRASAGLCGRASRDVQCIPVPSSRWVDTGRECTTLLGAVERVFPRLQRWRWRNIRRLIIAAVLAIRVHAIPIVPIVVVVPGLYPFPRLVAVDVCLERWLFSARDVNAIACCRLRAHLRGLLPAMRWGYRRPRHAARVLLWSRTDNHAE